MASKVNGLVEYIKPGGSNATQHAIASTAYGYCETAAATQIKDVDMTGFVLYEGVTVHIKFANINSADNPKLRINSSEAADAKPIVQYGTAAAGKTSETNGWYAGAVVSFTYDGTSWVRDQGFNTNTWRGIADNLTSSTATTTSLSAKQGYLLANGSARDSTKLPLEGGTLTGRLTTAKPINQIITGTGTVGSYTNSTYYPAKWTFNIGTEAPNNGDIITIKIPVAGHDYGVFLSINNGVNYHPVVLNGTGRLTTHYPVNTYITVIFESTASASSMYALAGQTSSTRVTVSGGAWRVINYYDSNSDWGYYQRMIYPNLKAGNGKIHPYSIIMQLANGKFASLTTTAPNNPGTTNISPKATGKAANTNEFRLGPIYYMSANTTYSDGNNVGTYNVYAYNSNLIDCRYSFNLENTDGKRFTAYAPVYIVGTLSNGMIKLDYGENIEWWTTTLPNSDNGKIYIYLGDAYDWYRITLQENHPVYWYKDGAIRLYSGASEYALKAPLSGVSGADDLKAIEALSGTSGLLKKTAANTWTLDTTDYTTNTGTVTKVSTGAGLTGGDITTSGTVKANLTSETKLTNAAADGTETSGRVYPVRLDKNGKLAVNVPWTNVNSAYLKTDGTNNITGTLNIKPTSGEGGELHLHAVANTEAGIVLDHYGNSLRVFGIASADGTTKTGTGTPLVINPYAKTITGGYTLTGALTGNADTATTSTWTTLIKPIASTTTASASTWNIPSGSYQVWGERFSDTRLKYTPSGGSETTITDTGDWVMWLTPTSRGTATLNMRIDGTYYGSFSGSGASLTSLNASNISSGTLAIARIADSSITNAKLANSKVTIAGNDVSLGGSLAAATLTESLGLSKAMHFIGVATVAITDGGTENPTISGYDWSKKQAGDVVIDKDSSLEYVWSTTNKWERLGGDSSYKTTQSAVDSGSAATNKWVSRIQQNANGVITTTMGTLDTSGEWSGNAATATEIETAGTTAQFYRGDNSWSNTLVGPLYVNDSTDAEGTNDAGALIVGDKASQNVAIDNNEIMARNNKATSTLYVNNNGGLVSIGSGGLSTSGKITSTLVGTAAQFGNNSVLEIIDNATASSRKVNIKGKLNLCRSSDNSYGRISYYSDADYTWFTYMSNVGNGLAPTGGKPGVLGDVTGWAMRSLIEQNSGRGWIWESATNAAATANTTETKVRMSLSSYTGRLRIAPNGSSISNESAGLIVDSAKNGSSGNVAIELWRGGNASWQIANEGGILYFRNNYTTAKQSTYTQTSLSIAYNTGNATFAGSVTATGGFSGTLTGNVTGNVSGSSGSCTGNAASATKIAAKLATTTKTFLLGTSTTITGTAANVDLIGDTGVYLTTTAGQLSAKSYLVNDGANEKVRMEWNATDQSLDFIFA